MAKPISGYALRLAQNLTDLSNDQIRAARDAMPTVTSSYVRPSDGKTMEIIKIDTSALAKPALFEGELIKQVFNDPVMYRLTWMPKGHGAFNADEGEDYIVPTAHSNQGLKALRRWLAGSVIGNGHVFITAPNKLLRVDPTGDLGFVLGSYDNSYSVLLPNGEKRPVLCSELPASEDGVMKLSIAGKRIYTEPWRDETLPDTEKWGQSTYWWSRVWHYLLRDGEKKAISFTVGKFGASQAIGANTLKLLAMPFEQRADALRQMEAEEDELSKANFKMAQGLKKMEWETQQTGKAPANLDVRESYLVPSMDKDGKIGQINLLDLAPGTAYELVTSGGSNSQGRMYYAADSKAERFNQAQVIREYIDEKGPRLFFRLF